MVSLHEIDVINTRAQVFLIFLSFFFLFFPPPPFLFVLFFSFLFSSPIFFFFFFFQGFMALFAGDTGEIKPEVRDQIDTKVVIFKYRCI